MAYNGQETRDSPNSAQDRLFPTPHTIKNYLAQNVSKVPRLRSPILNEADKKKAKVVTMYKIPKVFLNN